MLGSDGSPVLAAAASHSEVVEKGVRWERFLVNGLTPSRNLSKDNPLMFYFGTSRSSSHRSSVNRSGFVRHGALSPLTRRWLMPPLRSYACNMDHVCML
jgi:hypothetical protein